VASIPFEIRGPRWRFYSRKTITPRMTGRWRVVLVDPAGKELAGSDFLVR
jgi:ligand-binding SRPBCC domain-containing protein